MVRTDDAVFLGYVTNGVHRYTGIRYGKCQRFAPAELYFYGGQEVAADEPCPYTPQVPDKVSEAALGQKVEIGPNDEYLLHLDVTVPENAGDKPLPVMVWIHGGAYENGGVAPDAYNPSLIALEGNVIVVSISYRLGFFGFVRDQDGEPANLGLLDQILALQWIHDNIEFFGGDPSNVTLFGQSAGGGSIFCHMLTEHAGVLFQRCIMQSAPFGSMSNREKLDQHYLSCAKEITDDTPIEEILALQRKATMTIPTISNAMFCHFAPIWGVYPVPREDDIARVWEKNAGKVELLIGATTREGAIAFVLDERLEKLLRMPIVGTFAEKIVIKKSQQIFTDGAAEYANRFARAGGNVYLYRLNWGIEIGGVGNCHCAELPLLFGHENYASSPLLMKKSAKELEDAGKQLRQIWASFARCGEPCSLSIPACINIKHVDA